MRVTLVFPRMDGPRPTTVSLASAECLGLGYLAAALRAVGHDVTIINAELENLSVFETLDRCLATAPDVLGCSPVSLSIDSALAVLTMAKSALPNVRTVLGGHLATLAAKDLLANEPSVDIVLKGDSEESLCDLVSLPSPPLGYDRIAGAVWRNERGEIQESLKSPHCGDLDSLPFPDRDDLKRIVELEGTVSSARMLASRGCRHSCSFCTTPRFYGPVVRFRSPDNVIREMEYLAAEFGIHHVWFNDDLFIDGSQSNAKWVEALSKLIGSSKYSFSFRVLCRADSFNQKNEYLLDLLKDAGLTHVFLGLEAGSAHSLEVYRKGYSPEIALEAVARLRARNLKLQIGFIMYNPYNTFDDLYDNLSFLHQIGELYRIFPLTRPLSVFPGTQIAPRLLRDGLMQTCGYREPLSNVRYVDQRVGMLAQAMYEAHEEFARLDNDLHKAFRGTGSFPKLQPSATEEAVSELNFSAFSSVLDIAAKGDENAVKSRIREWMSSLSKLMYGKQIERGTHE